MLNLIISRFILLDIRRLMCLITILNILLSTCLLGTIDDCPFEELPEDQKYEELTEDILEGVLDVVEGGLSIVECADGVTEEEIRAATLATVV